MRATEILRRVLVAAVALAIAGCASHRADTCRNPAKVLGAPGPGKQSGWVIVREDRSAEETAERIAKNYHVRTQPLHYVHGFSMFPVPTEAKFLCDQAVVEVHYDANNVAAR